MLGDVGVMDDDAFGDLGRLLFTYVNFVAAIKIINIPIIFRNYSRNCQC